MTPYQIWIAFITIVVREVRQFTRIWPQTLLPPAVTMTLYFVIFGNLIGDRIGPMEGYDYMEFIVPGLISDGGDHQFLCQCGVFLLQHEVPAQHRGVAGFAHAQLGHPYGLPCRWHGRGADCGICGDAGVAFLHIPGLLQSGAYCNHGPADFPWCFHWVGSSTPCSPPSSMTSRLCRPSC